MNQSISYLSSASFRYNKEKHIDSLKIFNYDVREIKPGIEYHVGFHNGSKQAILKIKLSPKFPQERPIIWTYPKISHKWVSDTGEIVSAPGLVNFSEHSDLGRIVQSIIQEFSKSVQDNQNGLLNERLSLSASQPNNHYLPIPPFIPELESLSLQQLENLNRCDEVLNQFVEDLPITIAVTQDLQKHMDTVEQMSRTIVHHKGKLQEKKQGLINSYEALNSLRQQWDVLSIEHQSLSQRYLPSNIELSLQKGASLAEEESEEIAEKFLSGQLDVESFLNSYTASRLVSHSRKTKEEILHKQLQELQRLGY